MSLEHPMSLAGGVCALCESTEVPAPHNLVQLPVAYLGVAVCATQRWQHSRTATHAVARACSTPHSHALSPYSHCACIVTLLSMQEQHRRAAAVPATVSGVDARPVQLGGIECRPPRGVQPAACRTGGHNPHGLGSANQHVGLSAHANRSRHPTQHIPHTHACQTLQPSKQRAYANPSFTNV